MIVGGHAPSSSISLHLDPKQARMMVNVELGVSMGDDAAIYLCVVLQHTIERLVAGALTSCGKPELRTKYGGTGKDVQSGADVQPRHLQDYIRTNKEMWSLFNSAFAFQVILSVFLDHATEMFFQRLGLPLHSKGALASCEYYATVIDGLQQQKKSRRLPSQSNNSGNPPAEQLLVTTPAQLARVAARVNPLCSLSPKACLMVEALTHEIFMALCEGVVRRRADARVITIVDLEGGIRDEFPEEMAREAAAAGKEAILTLSGGSAASPADGEPVDDQVRLCVRRLQGTRTLLRKKFRVSPGSLLFTVFTRACERLRIKESSVIFVHDGAILSGRQRAGTLLAEGRVVQVFAVCKRAWACKQRAAARRGLLLENGEASLSAAQARKKYANDSAHDLREKPWRQKHVPPVAPRTRLAAKGPHSVALRRPLLPIQPPPEALLHPPPPGVGTQGGGKGVVGASKRHPRPRQTRRWIRTPVEGGTNLDLGRLENARDPFPPRQRTGTFETGLLGSASTGALVGSSGGRGAGGAGIVVSPRIARTVRRLSAMEACLRNLEDSMKELQSGDLDGRRCGISSVAMAAITSQLDVAYNLSSLCRKVLSSADEGAPQAPQQASRPTNHHSLQGRVATQGQLHGGTARVQQQQGHSFLTEVPAEPHSACASDTIPPPAGKVQVASLGQDGYGGKPPEEEAAVLPAEEIPSSWSSMIPERNRGGGGGGGVGGHAYVIPEEEESSTTWSGYISEFQPATPPESTPTAGLSEENDPGGVDDPAGEGAHARSKVAAAGTVRQNNGEIAHNDHTSGAPARAKVNAERLGRTALKPRTPPKDGQRMQPQSFGMERGGSAKGGGGLSGGGARATKNASEGSHGGGEKHGGLALDISSDYERETVVLLGTTTLNADNGTGSGDTDGNKRTDPVAGVGAGSGGQAESPHGLRDAIPLEVRPPPDVLHQTLEPEGEDPYGDGDWDDGGDDEGHDGNWSSWLTGGGGGGALPSTNQ